MNIENTVCLFEHYEQQPTELKNLLSKYDFENETISYDTLRQLEQEVNKIGYTFEWGLDCIPYNLRALNTPTFTQIKRTIYALKDCYSNQKIDKDTIIKCLNSKEFQHKYVDNF